jgi:hypothetical protein
LFLLPFLRHRENASGQLFAIATDGGLVPMLVRDPTTFLGGRRTLCGKKKKRVSGTDGRDAREKRKTDCARGNVRCE